MSSPRQLRPVEGGRWFTWVGELGFWCEVPIPKGEPVLGALELHAEAMHDASAEDAHREAWEAVRTDAVERRVDRDPCVHPCPPDAFRAPRPLRRGEVAHV